MPSAISIVLGSSSFLVAPSDNPLSISSRFRIIDQFSTCETKRYLHLEDENLAERVNSLDFPTA